MTDETSKTTPKKDGAEAEVRILPPDFSIKEKIGRDVDISKVFSPERVQAAQKSIDDTKHEFVQWVQDDLNELEKAYAELATQNIETQPDAMHNTCKIVFSLKCQGGTFGYDLASKVADSLYRYLMKHKNEPVTPEVLTVTRKHIDALQVIFQQNMVGEGNAVGKELLDNLSRLVAKLG